MRGRSPQPAAAVKVPALNAEAAAWTVRGWADVAVGCLALDGSAGPEATGAFGGLDEVVRDTPVISAGQHAARLRQLRQFAGPVPPWYPDARPVSGPVRGIGQIAWQAAELLARFGKLLMMTAGGLPWRPPCPLRSARQLAWGVRYRPSPSDEHVTVRLPVNRWLARRTWMCLPGLPGPGTAVAEVAVHRLAARPADLARHPRGRAPGSSQRVWLHGPGRGWRRARRSSAPG